MATIKGELSQHKIPKSGKNKFSGFTYHELGDFMPFINELNARHGVNAMVNIKRVQNLCYILLVNTEDTNDRYCVEIPLDEAEMLSNGGGASKVDKIQRLGSTVTYLRRYLFMTAYDIVESDGVDASSGKPAPKEKLSKDRFDKAVIAISEGKAKKSDLDKYDLTEEQIKTLNK